MQTIPVTEIASEQEWQVAGLVVRTVANRSAEVAASLSRRPGISVVGEQEGRIAIVVEVGGDIDPESTEKPAGSREKQLTTIMNNLSALSGVLSTSLIYHAID